ncbi:septum site-determining protein MinC [Hespellia stercorisuis]|uniref:Probable septum site-determining protein MinC n=1 Tax=Hespellia stercorisuis DSM 15480 TaxID=1121950 RepID=A0A1M6N3H7_9FIRM|nr:septum site-determining protein MinC [Hespellia stercorisuis]SHJ90227.1 septum site-determining protein MinC [Hespellia stercorisuis DSM 15480]
MDNLVKIKSSKYGLEVYLNAEVSFEDLLLAVHSKFQDAAKFFNGAKMAASFSGRVMTSEEEQQLIQVISKAADIDIICIIDKDEENDLIYRNLLDTCYETKDRREGQFYKGTLYKRQVLESETSIIVLGDVEPGAKIAAKGNIVVIGKLYGSVHAGITGDRSAFVVALDMQPKHLKIADVEAKRQNVYQENSEIDGPKIAVLDRSHIYIDPLVY